MKNRFLKHWLFSATILSSLTLSPVFADVQLGAKMLWDHGYYDGVYHKEGRSGNDSAIRFVRLYLKARLDEHWEGMLQTQITEHRGVTNTTWKEVFLKYNGLGPFDITLGKRKEPFGLQMLVNAERVLFLERAMISSAFAPERSIGATVFTAPGNSSFELGVYSQNDTGNASYSQGSPQADNAEQDTYAVTGRATLTPWQKDHSLFHIGLAGSYRDFGGNDFQVKQRPEMFFGQKIVTSGITPANSLNVLGVEAAALLGPFSFQSEYMQLSVEAEEGAEDAKYDGYYVQLGYLLTNGYRAYNKGKFGAIKPLSKYGAWQLMARYSVLDAEDNEAGVEAENITLGLNWFPNTSARISANYIMTQLDGVDKPTKDDGDAFIMRFQYVF
jgi:phosphate-selective porin OprO and OprP